ncbi:hypothetical protein [Micromonospora antibiotica]|uniref:hypothetical protein n=1 Tax=Micromonospora antibiotica TaxID=2807623 RepID=UPI001ABDA9E3|nr:hypothetical protein [Micromonospora antibiotica]
MALRPAGQYAAVTTADEPTVIEFRRSRGREVGFLATALPVLAVALAVVNLASGDPWWDGLWLPLTWFLLWGFFRGVARPPSSGQRPGLPLRLAVDHLQVAGPGERTLAIEWSNVARAEISGWWYPVLAIEPADPDRTRPPIARWEWATYGQSRPYEIRVPLVYLSPGRDQLRRELARRLPA